MNNPIKAAHEGWQSLPRTARAMLLVLVGSFCGSAMGGLIRYVSADLHAFEIVFLRCLAAVLILTPTLFKYGLRVLHTKHIGMHVARGLIQSFTMIAMFLAVTLSPLAKVTSMQFTSPLFATVLAVLVLGEVIRVRRMVALAIGFSGALIVLRPWVGDYDIGALLALAAAAVFSIVMILMRKLGKTESGITQTIYMALLATPLAFFAALTVWQTPTLVQLAWIALIGLLGTIANLFLAQALREAELTAVLPMQFVKLIWAALIGFIFFAEIPDIWTWMGGTVIFASATYIGLREHHLTRESRRWAADDANA